jgi:hypothetical protein
MVTMNYQVTYNNGDRYVGPVCNTNTGATVPHGYGTKYYINGDVYKGNFYLNARHGYGTLQYTNGDFYRGNFQNDTFHGQGESFRVREQRRYVGQFYMGYEEGYATVTSVDIPANGGNKKYVGWVRKGMRYGQGTQYITGLDGQMATFQGEWVNGLLNGPGSLTTSRQVLSGIFREGKLEGLGTSMDPTIGVTNQVLFQNGHLAMYVK